MSPPNTEERERGGGEREKEAVLPVMVDSMLYREEDLYA